MRVRVGVLWTFVIAAGYSQACASANNWVETDVVVPRAAPEFAVANTKRIGAMKFAGTYTGRECPAYVEWHWGQGEDGVRFRFTGQDCKKTSVVWHTFKSRVPRWVQVVFYKETGEELDHKSYFVRP
jgi:hypothetical protein